MPRHVGDGWYRFGVDEERDDLDKIIWGDPDGNIWTGHTSHSGKVYLLFDCGDGRVGLNLDTATMRHLANDLLGACDREEATTASEAVRTGDGTPT
jgi:hypothetical protein